MKSEEKIRAALRLEPHAAPERTDEWEAFELRARRARVSALRLGVLSILVVIAIGAFGGVRLLNDDGRPDLLHEDPESAHELACRDCTPPHFHRSRKPGWRSYHSHVSGWLVDVPADWHIRAVDESRFRYSSLGVFISNLDVRLLHPDLGRGSFTSAWDSTGLDPSSVVLQIASESVGGIRLACGVKAGASGSATACPPDTKYPLSWDLFTHADAGYGPFLQALVKEHGVNDLVLRAWIGEKAKSTHEATARAIVESIRTSRPIAELSPEITSDGFGTSLKAFMDARIQGRGAETWIGDAVIAGDDGWPYSFGDSTAAKADYVRYLVESERTLSPERRAYVVLAWAKYSTAPLQIVISERLVMERTSDGVRLVQLAQGDVSDRSRWLS